MLFNTIFKIVSMILQLSVHPSWYPGVSATSTWLNILLKTLAALPQIHRLSLAIEPANLYSVEFSMTPTVTAPCLHLFLSKIEDYSNIKIVCRLSVMSFFYFQRYNSYQPSNEKDKQFTRCR